MSPEKLIEFYEAWWFLTGHELWMRPRFEEYPKMLESFFAENLETTVHKVNPDTESIDDDKGKNTKVEIWLEVSVWNEESGVFCGRDPDLDCGGDTFEDAIIELAHLVKDKYGDKSCHDWALELE